MILIVEININHGIFINIILVRIFFFFFEYEFLFFSGIYDEDPEIITLSRADFCKNLIKLKRKNIN
jgi:hypothetical protein